jgi:hypothetical protein
MKLKRLMILTLAFSTLGAFTAYADTIGQKIKVMVNNKETDDPGYIVDGKTFLPLREMSDVLRAMITWDDAAKKVVIYKPNVHIFLFDKDFKYPFTEVLKGEREFTLVSQVDNILADVQSLKVIITDPYGKDTDIVQATSISEYKDSFSYKSKTIEYDFKYTGKYTLKFMMKLEKSDEYQVVGEKVINSRTK